MTFDHEKLDVYRVSLEFVAWVYPVTHTLKGLNRHIRDQLTRSAISIPLNIAEGVGKRSPNDRKRFLEIARGSAMESAAALDVLVVTKVIPTKRVSEGKTLLFRVVSMLSKMTGGS